MPWRRALRESGDAVLVADRDLAAAGEVASLPAAGEGAALECDLSVAGSEQRVVDAALELSGGRLDVVVHTAGVLHAAALEQWSAADWDHSLALNLRSPFLLTQAAAPHLRRSGAGRVVLTSSTGALRGHAGMPAYHASKAGLLGLVRALADELAPAVTVNCVCPGWINTPFNDAYWDHQGDSAASRRALEQGIPMGRQGTPSDVAGTVLFLASSAAAYVTGQAFVVDGGYTAV